MRLKLGGQEVTVSADVAAGSEGTDPRREGPVAVSAHPGPRAQPVVEWGEFMAAGFDGPDPALIAVRCRLKAEACRLAAERRRRRLGGTEWWDVSDSIGQAIARAKQTPHCYLWPVDPRGPALPDDEAVASLAGSYDALGDAVELLARCGAEAEGEPFVEPASRLAAEAQSALRAAMLGVEFSGGDRDQQETFRWMAGLTRERGIYIERHMRVEDPADPLRWADLRARVAALGESAGQRQRSKREREKLMSKARYHARRLAQPQAGDPPAEWRSLQAAVEALLAAKVPPSDRGLREIMAPLYEAEGVLRDEFLSEMTAGMSRVLDEVGRHLGAAGGRGVGAEEPGAAEPAGGGARRESAEVAQVAGLLQGRRMVLIGGECRNEAKAALERAFGLSELEWLDAPPHASFWDFEPAVAREDTAIVLLAIRWSSHSFGAVRTVCERHGKPLVRLPGGYSPAQVAFQIAQQAGEQLSASAGRRSASPPDAGRAPNSGAIGGRTD